MRTSKTIPQAAESRASIGAPSPASSATVIGPASSPQIVPTQIRSYPGMIRRIVRIRPQNEIGGAHP